MSRVQRTNEIDTHEGNVAAEGQSHRSSSRWRQLEGGGFKEILLVIRNWRGKGYCTLYPSLPSFSWYTPDYKCTIYGLFNVACAYPFKMTSVAVAWLRKDWQLNLLDNYFIYAKFIIRIISPVCILQMNIPRQPIAPLKKLIWRWYCHLTTRVSRTTKSTTISSNVCWNVTSLLIHRRSSRGMTPIKTSPTWQRPQNRRTTCHTKKIFIPRPMVNNFINGEELSLS